MVGLSIVLETSDGGVISPKPRQVVNKSDVKVNADAIATVRHGFLEHCFLCTRKLLPAKDIYMYQGDRAFCSVECRSKQMIMDEEESLRRENCSFMAPSSSDGHLRHRRDPNRAGGFAY